MILNYICFDIFQMIFGIFSILGTLYCELGLRKNFVKLKKNWTLKNFGLLKNVWALNDFWTLKNFMDSEKFYGLRKFFGLKNF